MVILSLQINLFYSNIKSEQGIRDLSTRDPITFTPTCKAVQRNCTELLFLSKAFCVSCVRLCVSENKILASRLSLFFVKH